MIKLLWIILGLGLLVYLAQEYETQSCKDLVKELNLTVAKAKEKYEECKKF